MRELWTSSDEANWLGWLHIVKQQQSELATLVRLADPIRKPDFTHILLLGMGGSSLGPEVFAETFGRQDGRPELLVLDSTDPAQIRAFASRIDPVRTLFLVSSKSGSTLEPNILKDHFFECVTREVGPEKAATQFIAITDPGSSLRSMAERDRFRAVMSGMPSIGGRYSVLSNFGLVPAALMGLDVARLLAETEKMVRSCSPNVPPVDNPGVALGAVLGVLGKSGRDKVTIVASPGIADFGAWLEQLLAESTGKHGKGLIPVDDEPSGSPDVYGADRLFVYLRLAEGADAGADDAIARIEGAGHPVVRIEVSDRYHLGQEFFRWEMATAVAGSILGINPFDQPDVEASKEKTRELTAAFERSGHLPEETPVLEEGVLKVFAEGKNREAIAEVRSVADCLAAHFGRIRDGDYCALLAYVERNAAHRERLAEDAAADTRPQARCHLCWLRAALPAFNRDRPTRAAPIRVCFCNSPVTTPWTCRFPGGNLPSVSSRRRRREAISTCWSPAGAGCCAFISAPMSWPG